ncbi:bifunctional aspartate kinase/homoserine dehydrogenase I [Nonlabens xiamenensis]|uniref:bifunctional aspartate kinase/homoserine dehydrogenase I n=1 Tax=Nonlabens xiamenensis TaxID=2341043 RepID=UPI000F6055E5|nr:bifunctional aspartate kinase/homoserine dehydrogenase I [Nonlabens xiamenensis]
MKVLKFGGTSVGSATNIRQVIDIVSQASSKEKVIVVMSAVGGVTDQLLYTGQLAQAADPSYRMPLEKIRQLHFELWKELVPDASDQLTNELHQRLDALQGLLDGIYLINELSPKTMDKLLGFGELLSSYIISQACIQTGLQTTLKNSQELIVTDDQFTKAQVDIASTYLNINRYFSAENSPVHVLPGFVARSSTGVSTTLGRGGSDYTAAMLAAALKVNSLEIWTDVSGMYTANPKLVKQAYPIPSVNYQEAMELSHFGAKVLYAPTIQPVLAANIPLWIKNTMNPTAEGTQITQAPSSTQDKATGISNIDNIALLTLEGSGMVGIPGFSKRLFEELANARINVVLITQASSEHSICLAIDEEEVQRAERLINQAFTYEITQEKLRPVTVEKDLAIIALVGRNMKQLQGISGKMFGALGRNNINIRAIAQGASEMNISAVIQSKDVKKALNTLHERFFEGNHKQINLFIAGVGNVGEKLLEQIRQQRSFLKKNHKLNLRVVGISNSRTMFFDQESIPLENWKELLSTGEKAQLEEFRKKAVALNLRNSVFVDVTASELVAQEYEHYLKQSISVVACNKIACSSDIEHYKKLKQYALTYNAAFFYETNVGAGLPVIDTLRNLVASGDQIQSIKAVLSGSLNFVFNNFDDQSNFHDVVKEAQVQGFTEPDPRIDLSGVDVARKILILAREAGMELSLKDIENQAFLLPAHLEADQVADFYKLLIQDEAHFQSLYASAKAKQCQLKYVASLEGSTASVGLQEIPAGHPFYNLKGSDNIVMFYTKRYPEQPMIIKGAGAGADVTASGLFADIIRIGNS